MKICTKVVTYQRVGNSRNDQSSLSLPGEPEAGADPRQQRWNTQRSRHDPTSPQQCLDSQLHHRKTVLYPGEGQQVFLRVLTSRAELNVQRSYRVNLC